MQQLSASRPPRQPLIFCPSEDEPGPTVSAAWGIQILAQCRWPTAYRPPFKYTNPKRTDTMTIHKSKPWQRPLQTLPVLLGLLVQAAIATPALANQPWRISALW